MVYFCQFCPLHTCARVRTHTHNTHTMLIRALDLNEHSGCIRRVLWFESHLLRSWTIGGWLDCWNAVLIGGLIHCRVQRWMSSQEVESSKSRQEDGVMTWQDISPSLHPPSPSASQAPCYEPFSYSHVLPSCHLYLGTSQQQTGNVCQISPIRCGYQVLCLSDKQMTNIGKLGWMDMRMDAEMKHY